MALRLSIPTSPADPTFQRVLSYIPAGDQWWRGNVTHYAEVGGVDLMLQADVGQGLVSVYVNGNLKYSLDVTAPTTILNVELDQGYNTLYVTQGTNTFQTRLIAAFYAVFLGAFAEETYGALERDIEVFEQHFRSYFSTRITEHQIQWSDLLPSSFAYRTLLGKIGVRALVNESSKDRGVEDIVSVTTLSNPYVLPTTADDNVQAPFPLYTESQDFAGDEFHVWYPNSCVAAWHGFVRLLDMFRTDELYLIGASDEKVTLSHEGNVYDHYFDTEDAQCVQLVDPCAVETYVYATLTSSLDIWLCPWSYPFDVSVSIPLGRARFDQDNPFDTGTPLDSMELTAPLDGWMGVSLSNRFDAPSCLDSSTGGGSSAFGTDDICCPSPVVALLVEGYDEVFIDARPRVYATQTSLPA